MAIGGPAAFGIGLFKGIASHRSNARSQARDQLNEALRLQKEDRESKEAIAKGGLAYDKAKSEAALAESELALVQQRRAQIMASPGAPFKDAALEGHLEEARSRLEDAHAELQERQGKLQDLIADRDARVRGAIPPTKAGGFLGFGQSEVPPEKRTPEQREAYKTAIRKGEQEQGTEFNKAANPVEREIRQAETGESRERAKIAGGEKAIEAGQSQQGTINEEKRNAQMFPLDKESSELRAKQVEAQSGMAAAAQRIQAQQQQQAALQATPGYARAMQGGSATGKGGGGGGGLLGAVTGKGGSGGAPAPVQGGGAPAPGGAVPTVGQAIGPMLGKVAQMPLPQAVSLVKGAFGGNQGGQGGAPFPPQRPGAPLPPQRPQFGQPQSFAGPRRPVQVPVPSVAMEGRGGGLTSEASAFQPHRGREGVVSSRDLYGALISRGASPAAAAALAGNAAFESGAGSWDKVALNPATDAGRKNWGTGDAAVGAFQWEGSRKQGVGPSLDSQAQHVIDELNRGGPTTGGLTLGQLNAIKDPRQAAAIVNRMYERPQSPNASMSARQNYAENIFRNYGGGGGGGGTRIAQASGGQPSPSAGISPPLPPLRPASSGQAAAGAQGEAEGQKKGGFKPPKASAPPVPDVYHPTPSQPIDIKPFAGQPGPQQSPQQMGMQTYGQQGGQPQGMAPPQDIGPPLIHSQDQLKGMKPGSLFKTPDGRLKIVPLVEAGQ